MADARAVSETLKGLNPDDDGHWTSQGLPRMDVLAGLGLTIDRRELNELVPGFSRAVAKKAREDAAVAAPAADAPAPISSIDDDLRRQSENSFKHLLARDARRKAALAHLAAGGFTVADLQDTTSPLQRRISAQNRASRRELS